MKAAKTGLKRWAPAILIMVIIFIASSTPGNDIPGFGGWDTFVKKGAHMAGYALLAVGYLHALSNSAKASRTLFIIAILLAGLYAATDEFHQSFTPGRNSSIRDVGIDALGALIGTAIWARIFTQRQIQKTTEKHK
jgi:VanZ family protein